MLPPLLICDFDGTLTEMDVGDALCDRFAPPAWRDVDDAFLRGEMSLPDAQRQMWSMVRASRQELLAHARQVGALRPGAEALFEAAAAGELELVVASGGFDLYIDALLGERTSLLRARYHNRLISRDGGGVELEFAEGLACHRCAVCKAEVVRRHLDPGRRVAFCGDGASDQCAAAIAPELFAIQGGDLAHHCTIHQIPFTPLTTLHPLLTQLRGTQLRGTDLRS